MDPAISTKQKAIKRVRKDAGKLADFIMFRQRSFLLNLSKELNTKNVSFTQFFLLGYLANEDYLTMTDISKNLGHSTAAATGIVDRLEKLGYAQRLHASDDRRKVMVQITRKGIDLVERMREDIVENLVEVMELMGGTDDVDSGVVEAIGDTSGKSGAAEESQLVSALNSGLRKDFWNEYRALSEKLESGDLDVEENARLLEMSDQIERADVKRLAAATRLADLRGVTFDEIISEYQIAAPTHE